MSATRVPPTFESCRDVVNDLMESGEPFGQVEDVIERSGLNEDTRAALWLLAFFEQGAQAPTPAARQPRA